mgnify:FL=1
MASSVVISGASGLIGSALAESLRADGVSVRTLVRHPAVDATESTWDPGSTLLDPDVLAGADAVINLNGASIGKIPWTRRYKSTLLWSRLAPTRTLATALRALGADAPAFVSASAVGFYGSAPGAVLDEAAAKGQGFLADVCSDWEEAARRAEDVTRVALVRTAPVVDKGGVLAPLITLTRMGVAGPLGSGTQVWPWISLIDEVRAIRHVIDQRISGPVNLTGAARAVMNDLGFALAQRLNRPYLVPAPAFALRAALGADMADSVLLADAHVVPSVLESSGFTFTHPTVESAVDAAI